MSNVQTLKSVVIRFAGDSGDGMQLTGDQFTNTSALIGNDLATFPDFPAEIRAPAGTRAGVSGFQVHIASEDIFTPGDAPSVLIAMNPAALVTNISGLERGGTVIVNTDKFTDRDLKTAELDRNPLEDGSLDDYRVIPVKLSTLTRDSVEGLGLGTKEADRCKNFFALGLSYWLFSRPLDATQAWINKKFKSPYKEANLQAMQAGWNYALTAELMPTAFDVPKAQLTPGTYRNIMGNTALSLGLVTAAQKAGLPMFLGSYPITPASDILHTLSNYKHYGVSTFQAEDEIAAICSAIGASYGGAIGLTTTSGPGMALKAEAMGLALMTELPLVVINVQRAGPSTGMPTKTEQADLMQALYGRNGESPLPVVAAATPADCFDTAIEAVRISLKYMIPVILLTDGYIANGSEPWKLPDPDDIPPLQNRLTREHNNPDGAFLPYKRDPQTLARPWVVPGVPGLEHRIGGLEKQDVTGNISYDALNHQRMSEIRRDRVEAIAQDVPPAQPYGDEGGLLVIGWGSPYGAIRQAVRAARAEGTRCAHLHLRHLNPLPSNLGEVMRRYDRVVVPELNLGQLVFVLRAKYGLEILSLPKIHGQPFKVSEIKAKIDSLTTES